jgi:hypothetical protein
VSSLQLKGKDLGEGFRELLEERTGQAWRSESERSKVIEEGNSRSMAGETEDWRVWDLGGTLGGSWKVGQVRSPPQP